MIYQSFCEKDTFEIAEILSKTAKPGQVYALEGELASGKTVFAKGFGAGLNIKDQVTSPSYSLLNIYNGDVDLYHFDLYRLSREEISDLAPEEYFDKGVCLIEWANNAENLPVDFQIIIKKNPDKGANFRLIEVKS